MHPSVFRSAMPIFSTIALLTAVCVAALIAVGGW